MRRPCRGLRCGAGAAGLSARRWLSSGSRGIRGRWENRCYPSLDPLAGLASQVVGTSLLPPSPWPSPAWRSRASRSSRGSHPKMRSGGLRGLRSRPELLLPPGKSARFDIGLPRCSRNRAASFLSWDSYGGGERIAASRHPSPLHRSRSGVHSHRHCWRLRRRGGHPRRMFRPRGFAPPRRLPPPERSRACFIPLPILGFAAFRAPLRSRWHPKMPVRDGRCLPRDVRFVPLEGCSPLVAAPRHRGRCPPAVSTTSRLCSTIGSGTHAVGCPTTCARPSWASFPLQGPSGRQRARCCHPR
jgi:hypothetical protein